MKFLVAGLLAFLMLSSGCISGGESCDPQYLDSFSLEGERLYVDPSKSDVPVVINDQDVLNARTELNKGDYVIFLTNEEAKTGEIIDFLDVIGGKAQMKLTYYSPEDNWECRFSIAP